MTAQKRQGPGGRGHRRSRRAGRSRSVRALFVGLAVGVLLGGALTLAAQGRSAPKAPQARSGSPSRPSPDGAERSPAPERTAPARPTPTKRPTAGATDTTVGDGVFTTASSNGKVSGHGTIRRYLVQVEQGTGVSADAAAEEIAGILADPRGWTADGHDAFQLVSGGAHDFTVKIATPNTVDQICGAAGLHTHGEVNCDVGDQVMVNLKRWTQGSPEFPGPIHEYRALIVNHEVGHRIGHGHEGCPGPGKPAPAMMQQIDGLHGCVANAWPYDADGHYLSGPPAP